jgi:hypothetical protein
VDVDTCEYCGEPLQKWVFGRSRIRKNKRFCDSTCGERARRKGQRSGEKPRSCLYCGEMLPMPKDFGRIPTYCGPTCRKASSRMGKGKVSGDISAEQIDMLFNRAKAQLAHERRTGA